MRITSQDKPQLDLLLVDKILSNSWHNHGSLFAKSGNLFSARLGATPMVGRPHRAFRGGSWEWWWYRRSTWATRAIRYSVVLLLLLQLHVLHL